METFETLKMGGEFMDDMDDAEFAVLSDADADRAAHPERTRAVDRAWRAKNPEKAREATRRYRARHPERARENVRRYRAKLLANDSQD